MSLTSQSVKPTIKANYIHNVLQAYEAKGLDGSALLDNLGILPLSSHSEIRISVSQFMELTQAIQDELGDEMLGFLNTAVPPGSLAMISHTLIKFANVGDALGFYNDFLTLFNGNTPVLLQHSAASNKLELQCCSELQATSPYFMQRMLLTSYKSMCWLTKSKLALKKVAFGFQCGPDKDELDYVFGCSNIVEESCSYIEFEEDVFKLPITQDADNVDDFSKNFGFYTLLWPKLSGIEPQIRQIIGSDLAKGFPSFDQVADALNMSTQTLSRRLQDEDTSYQSIKDDIRRDAAIAFLNAGELSIKEIAYHLGFKESSSFSKAFKQWVGITPTRYREA
ncbi:MAG: AraC family transcriptional regulator [Pseudomonadales bacterium]|nr:AraC family transcriptional regulator [Pseudomonadales bacterium]